MKKLLNIALTLLVLISLSTSQTALANEEESNLVISKLFFSKQGAAVNNIQKLLFGIEFKIKDGWHIYWRNSGESGMSTRVDWIAPEGSSFGEIQWPVPEKFAELGDIQTIGFENTPIFLQEASIPLSEKETKVTAELKWLVCKDICIPGSVALSKDINQDGSSDFIQRAKKEIPSLTPTSQNKYHFKYGKKLSSFYISLNSFELDENHIQVFPYKYENFLSSRPLLKTFTTKDGSKKAAIKIDITPTTGELPADPNFSAVISLSKALSKNNKERSFIWSNASAEVEKNGLFLEELKWDEASPLSYKLISHEEKESGKLSAKDSKPLITQQESKQNISLFLAIIYGFIGGIILNLMPCVLPIISIKVMSFIEGADKSRKDAFASSFAFSSGILFSFFVLACVVTFLRSIGFELGWGFQFQHPEFVYVLILIIFVISLGFFDIYTISMPFMQEANKRSSKIHPGKLKDFFDGILATALSTPCSAPFLGVALVVAFTQSTLATFLIFIAIGLGLALPYCFLATRPSLLAILPKPGPWMFRLRQLMGFLLFGTIIWLLFVLGNLKEDAHVWAKTSILLIFFSSWLWNWKKESPKNTFVSIFFVLSLIISSGVIFKSVVFMNSDNSISADDINWLDFSPELVSEKLKDGQAVFIDFTADWCVTCKANELYTISSKTVRESIDNQNIASIKADWTSADPVVTDALHYYGAKGVPHYVILSPHRPEKAVVLSTLPTASDLIEAFEKANMP